MVISLADRKSNAADSPEQCSSLPPAVLSNVLGGAYNSRYMSIQKPVTVSRLQWPSRMGHQTHGGHLMKRMVKEYKPFYVDDTYEMELSDEPAWNVRHYDNEQDLADEATRPKRKIQREEPIDLGFEEEITLRPKRDFVVPEGTMERVRNGERPWRCEGKVKWIDLGPNYFPQYLRTVECTKKNCFYGHYTCRPRSFTIKILRLRKGECVSTKQQFGLPGDLREKWIWEERAVNFCCECKPN